MFLKSRLIKKCATLSVYASAYVRFNLCVYQQSIDSFIKEKKTFREATLQKTWHMLLVLINGLLHSRANNIGTQG